MSRTLGGGRFVCWTRSRSSTASDYAFQRFNPHLSVHAPVVDDNVQDRRAFHQAGRKWRVGLNQDWRGENPGELILAINPIPPGSGGRPAKWTRCPAAGLTPPARFTSVSGDGPVASAGPRQSA